jgi:hypothetical protein
VTPTSDEPLPADPAQSAASEAGAKLKPLEVGAAATTGLLPLWVAAVDGPAPVGAAGPVAPPTLVDPAAIVVAVPDVVVVVPTATPAPLELLLVAAEPK